VGPGVKHDAHGAWLAFALGGIIALIARRSTKRSRRRSA
jgi:hypothetical protein